MMYFRSIFLYVVSFTEGVWYNECNDYGKALFLCIQLKNIQHTLQWILQRKN